MQIHWLALQGIAKSARSVAEAHSKLHLTKLVCSQNPITLRNFEYGDDHLYWSVKKRSIDVSIAIPFNVGGFAIERKGCSRDVDISPIRYTYNICDVVKPYSGRAANALHNQADQSNWNKSIYFDASSFWIVKYCNFEDNFRWVAFPLRSD
jgi:hypothetical protein